MERQLLPLNLQMFAEGEAETGVESGEAGQVGEASEKASETFTPPASQAELDSLVGKAVNKALENARKNHQKELNDAVQNALTKEKDYSKLSEEERKRKEFEDEQAEFEKRKAEFAQQQLVLQIKGDLVGKSLPVEFAETLALLGDAEKALEAVGVLEKAFDEAVAEKVKASLRQKTPSVGGGNANTANYGASIATANANTNPNGQIF